MSPLSSTFTDEGNIPRRVEIGQWSPRSSEASLSPTGSLGVLSLADSSVVSGAASGVDTSCNSSPSPYGALHLCLYGFISETNVHVEPGQYDDAPFPPDDCTALSATLPAHPSNSSTSLPNPSTLDINLYNGPSDAEEPNGTRIVLEGNPPATTLPPNDAHGPDSVTPPAALVVSRPKSPESGLDSSTTTIQQSSPSSPQRRSVNEFDPAHPPQPHSSDAGPTDNTPRALYSHIEHSPIHLEEQFEGLSFFPFTPTSTQPSLPLQSEISAARSDAPRAYPNIGNPSSDAVGTPTQTYPGISSPHPVNPIYSEPEWWDPDNLLSSQEAYMNTMANAMATPTTQRHRSLQLDGSYQDVAPHGPMNAREQGSTSGTGHTDDGSAETKRDGKGKGKATKFLEPPGLKWGASRRTRQRDKRREERNGWRSASDGESSGDESGDSSHPGSDSNSSVGVPPDIYVASPQGTLVPVPSTASPANPSGNGSSVFFPQVEPTPSPGPPLPLPIEDSTKEQVVLTDSDSESETIIDPSGVNLGLNFWGNFPMPFGYNDSNSNPYLTPNHGTSTGRLSSVHLGASPGGWATGTPLSLQGFPTPRPSGSTTRDGSHSLHRSPWLGPTAPDARYSQHSQGWPESFPTPGNRNQSAHHGPGQGYAPLPPSTGSTARNASLQATPLHPGGQTPSLLTPLGSTPWQGRPLRGLPGSHTSPMFFSPWGTGPANPHQMLPPNLTPNTTPGVGHASPFFSSFGGMQPGHQQQTPNWNATPNTAPPAYSGGNLHPNNNGTWTSSGAGGQGLLLPTAYRLHPRFSFADSNVSFVVSKPFPDYHRRSF